LRGPRGVGALWLAKDLEPLVLGGGQEGGLRPGTESLQAAWAFSRATGRALETQDFRRAKARAFEKRLIEGLSEVGALALPLGRKAGDERYSPFILSLAFPGLAGEVMVRVLSTGSPEAPSGIAVSTGAACSTNARDKKGRRVLEAMGLDERLAFSAIRVSTGELTTEAEIEAFIAAATAHYRRLRT
ncbi:MAG: aminotransferase class V-fold PLP-dependent enzyme, partial [Spirochaetota bacterium]